MAWRKINHLRLTSGMNIQVISGMCFLLIRAILNMGTWFYHTIIYYNTIWEHSDPTGILPYCIPHVQSELRRDSGVFTALSTFLVSFLVVPRWPPRWKPHGGPGFIYQTLSKSIKSMVFSSNWLRCQNQNLSTCNLWLAPCHRLPCCLTTFATSRWVWGGHLNVHGNW